jgi:hypothetical protein
MKALTNEWAFELLDRIGHKPATRNSWGIATKDFSNGGCWWFNNLSDLQLFLKEGLPALEIYPEETGNFEQQYNHYLSLLANIGWEKPDFKELMKYHNDRFSNDIEVIWIGPYTELAEGDSSFALFIREEFQESTKPITREQIMRFQKFLAEDVANFGLFDPEYE